MIFNPLISFKLFLSLSFFFALSSSSSFMLWISLELNMLSFLPLMSYSGYKMMENTMKYFLVQSLASSLFLLSSLLGIFLINSSLNLFIYLSLFLKLGSVPFHTWFVSLLKSVNMWVLFFLCTFQKIIPLIIIFMLNSWIMMMVLAIFMNSLVIFLNGFILLNFNMILAYSSINNLSWMLLGYYSSMQITSIFFMIYMFLMLGILLFLWNPSMSIFIQIQSMNYYNKLMILLVMMSLGGLPPFMGFLGKVMILKQTICVASMFLILFLIFSSLSILFFYMNFMYISMTMLPSATVMMNYKDFSVMNSMYMFTFYSFTILTLYIF